MQPTAGEPLRVAFVGVGRMGLPMCRNLIRAGFAVTAADIRTEVEKAALAAGARWAGSAAVAAADADVLITMLPGPPEVHDVMLGSGAALAALPAGATWIDMSSNSPAAGRSIAAAATQRGIEVLDAPVGGGVPAAEAGTLQLYVGGNSAVLERYRSLLEAIAEPACILPMGETGSGYSTKLLINLLWFGQAVALGEALLLASREGIDLETMQQALTSSAAASEFARSALPALLRGDYLRTFGIDRCFEELNGIVDLARQYDLPVELAEAVTRIYARAVERFGAEDGELLAIALLEQETGISLRSR